MSILLQPENNKDASTFYAALMCFCVSLIMGVVLEINSRDAFEIRIKYSGDADTSDVTVRTHDLDATEQCQNRT